MLYKFCKLSDEKKRFQAFFTYWHCNMARSRFLNVGHHRSATGDYNTFIASGNEAFAEFQNNLLYAAGCERGEKMHYFHDL